MTAALEQRIRRLYDETTPGWVDVWGEHLHHGYYGTDGLEKKAPRQAQIDMVDAVLAWSGVLDNGEMGRVLDAGCGVGGTSRYLASRLGAGVLGLTLSPVQKEIADTLSGDCASVRFSVADATQTGFKEGSFDLVWALESCEHMPSKRAFLEESARLLRPGGRLVVATWCHRATPPPLSRSERRTLGAISWSFQRSLTWVTHGHYLEALADLPFVDVRTADWSTSVTPFWMAVIRSMATFKGLRALASGGPPMWAGAYGGLEMRAALKSGLVRYVLLSAVRGASS